MWLVWFWGGNRVITEWWTEDGWWCGNVCMCCYWHEVEEARDACWLGLCMDISERVMESGTCELGWKTWTKKERRRFCCLMELLVQNVLCVLLRWWLLVCSSCVCVDVFEMCDCEDKVRWYQLHNDIIGEFQHKR